MSRSALVTGASKGIGKAIACRLGSDGFDVVVHYHSDREGADEAVSSIENAGARARLVQFDVSDRDVCRQTIESDIEEHGPYYAVVNNAGICRDNAFPALSGEEWDVVMDTNLDSFYNVIQPCVMPMIRARSGGRIVALSSVSGVTGNRGHDSRLKARIASASRKASRRSRWTETGHGRRTSSPNLPDSFVIRSDRCREYHSTTIDGR